MELTLQGPGDHHYIHSISKDGIRIGDVVHSGPVILSASELRSGWPVGRAEDLSESDIDAILELKPEIVLFGTGTRQVFLAPRIMMCFYRHSVGIEVMTTHAACRTFNVLVSEERNVVAALMPCDS